MVSYLKEMYVCTGKGTFVIWIPVPYLNSLKIQGFLNIKSS